jgi:hypothetical protein
MGQVRPTCALLGFPASLPAPSLSDIAPYLLAPAVLFGPLVAMYLDGDLPLQQAAQGAEGVVGRIKNAWRSWSLVDTRNYIVVSYISLVPDKAHLKGSSYRRNGLSIYYLRCLSPWQAILASSGLWYTTMVRRRYVMSLRPCDTLLTRM